MAPLLRQGQRLVIQKLKRYLAGDVVVFESATGELLVHRYLGPAPDRRMMTKPDAGMSIDVLVPSARVLGRVLSADGKGVGASIGDRGAAVLQYIAWIGRLFAGKLFSRSR